MTTKYGLQLILTIGILHGYTIARSTNGKHNHHHDFRRGKTKAEFDRATISQIHEAGNAGKSSLGQRSPPLSKETGFRRKLRSKFTHLPDNDSKNVISTNRYNRRHQLSQPWRHLDPYRKALIQGQRTFENSVMLENWKEKNQNSINRNLKRAKKVFSSRPNIRSVKIFHPRSFSSGMRSSTKRRKSEITKETTVHGHSGSLHVHASLDETRLVSKSGDLDVFIKNPDSEDMESNSKGNERDDVVFVATKENSNADDSNIEQKQLKDDTIRSSIEPIQRYHNNIMLEKDLIGLRESKDDKHIRKVINPDEHLCAVPPCTT